MTVSSAGKCRSGTSIQLACFFGQHDRNAGADGVSELGGARDQLLLLRIVFERSLRHGTNQNFQELRIDAAGGTVGRGAHDLPLSWIVIGIKASSEPYCRGV